MKSFLSSLLVILLAIAVILPLALVFGLLHAYVIQLYWSWFLIPVFPTLLPISLGKAYGLSLVSSAFLISVSKYNHKIDTLEGAGDQLKAGIKHIVATYVTLFVAGYVVHLLIS